MAFHASGQTHGGPCPYVWHAAFEVPTMTTPTLSFIHRFEQGRLDGPPLLVLHGTGGDEHALIGFARSVAPDATLLAPRGKVLENGSLRFFRRFAEGVFDEEDVMRRAHELADFIDAARRHYGLPAPIALGFSNGANIAAAILLVRPQTLAGAALLRAMTPLRLPPDGDLSGKRVLLVSGIRDEIVLESDIANLAGLLSTRGADVSHARPDIGHKLSQLDESLVAAWLSQAVGD